MSKFKPPRRVNPILIAMSSILTVCADASATDFHAPAGHIWFFGSGSGDIVMTDVMVPNAPTNDTYYETLGWNEGKEGSGYTGIQWDTRDGGPVWIFSLWNSISKPTTPITAVYTQPGGMVGNFGGEGTGTHYMNYSLGWKANQWYTSVVRNWNYNGNTYWGMWSYDATNQLWTHHTTFNYPVGGVQISGQGIDSFIEDPVGTGANQRGVELRNGWMRANRSWQNFDKGYFVTSGGSGYNGPYQVSFNAGITDNAFFMQTGGATRASFKGDSTYLTLPLQASNPVMTTGALTSVNASYNTTTRQVEVSWVPNPALSPQFSYAITVSQAGKKIATASDIAPHVRSAAVYIGNASCDQCVVSVALTDIFDHTEAPVSVVIPAVEPNKSPGTNPGKSAGPVQNPFVPPPGLPACLTAWSGSTIYLGGAKVSVNHVNYQSNWWTLDQNPVSNNGNAGSGQPWTQISACR